MRTAIYLRQSSDRSGDGLAVDRQRDDCVRLIEQRGWTVVGEYVDNDCSAAGRKPRPAFERLLTAVAAGEIDAIAAWSLDRLTRNRRDQLRIVETCEPRRTVLALVRGSDIDMSTPAGRLVADMLASMARHEIEQKSDRQARAQLQAAKQGRRVGGRRPFGYEPDGMTVRPEEAEAIRQAYADLLVGVTLAAIARDWNRRWLLTGKRRRSPGFEGQLAKWTSATVAGVLKNPRNAAIRQLKGEEVGPAVWPPIVPEETFRAAVAILRDPERYARGGAMEGRQLLTGVAFCGLDGCGLTVHGGGAVHRKPIYRCRSSTPRFPRCPGSHVNRLAEPVNDYIAAVVIERLSRDDAAELLVDHTRADVGELRDRTNTLRARLDSLAMEFADGELTASQVRTATERIRAKLADAEKQMADAGRVDVLGPVVHAEDVHAAWSALSIDRQRAIIETLMTIRLHPIGRGTRTFRPETVEIDWRTS